MLFLCLTECCLLFHLPGETAPPGKQISPGWLLREDECISKITCSSPAGITFAFFWYAHTGSCLRFRISPVKESVSLLAFAYESVVPLLSVPEVSGSLTCYYPASSSAFRRRSMCPHNLTGARMISKYIRIPGESKPYTSVPHIDNRTFLDGNRLFHRFL